MAMKYEVVANDLSDKIRQGVYKPNDQLPSVEKICEQYGVSKITVKKALDVMETAGKISRRRGSGSFVKNVASEPRSGASFETSGQMGGFKTDNEAKGIKVTSDVKTFEVIHPDTEVAHALCMDEDQFAYHIVRVRLANDVPRALEYTFMPIDVIPNLRRKTLDESIYRYIEGELGLKIASAHRIVRAVLPREEECEWLDIEAGAPLLEVEQVGFLDDGTPFEYSFSRHPRGYEFRSISTR